MFAGFFRLYAERDMARKRFVQLPKVAKNATRAEAKKILGEPGMVVDLDTAAIDLEHRLRMNVGSMWLMLAVALGMELLKAWLRRRQSQPEFIPETVFVAGEPGVEDEQGED